MASQKVLLFKKSLKLLAGIGSTLFVSVNVVPHLFPRTSVDMTYGLPPSMVRHINPLYKELLAETCNLMNIDSNKVELTHSRGMETISAGCLLFPKKSVIVLPRNTLYTHSDHLMHSGLSFDNTVMDWNSNIGKALKEVLILTDNEIRFLMGHELTHIKDYHFVANTLHGTGIFYGFYKLGTVLMKIPSKKLSLGGLIFGTMSIWIAGIPFYYLTKKPLSHYLEYSADETCAKLGEHYCDGGISYSRKKLKLNRILRAMSQDGEEKYSKIGNSLSIQDNHSHPKRTERLKKLKEISKSRYHKEVTHDID